MNISCTYLKKSVSVAHITDLTHQDYVDSHCAFDWFTAGKICEHGFRKLGSLVRNGVNAERSLRRKKSIKKCLKHSAFVITTEF